MMEVRDYKSGDETHILQLFKESFGKPLSEKYWKWRFLDNPLNKVMIKLMWDENKLVGHYAVSPIQMNVNGEQILTALSMTTMTNPNYVGKGIFTKLAEVLYNEESQKNNLKAVWGFPNNNSHYAFINKLQWIDLEQIPVRSLLIKKIINKTHSDISVVKAFKKEHIDAYQKLTLNQKIKIEKSIEYLTWRYIKNPSNDYCVFELIQDNISYFAVTKIFSSFSKKNKYEVDILELAFPADFECLNSLMNAIKEQYKEHDLLQINLWLSTNDNKYLMLDEFGFLNTLPTTYLGIRILDTRYNVLKEPQGWFYAMGDSDVY